LVDGVVARVAILLVMHDPVEARALCRRAVAMQDGRVVADGEWSEILRDPQTVILRRFKERFER